MNLIKVGIPTDSNLQVIERNAFSGSNIKGISLPSSVTIIGENAFDFCFNFLIIEISEESKLEYISKSFFLNGSKVIIMIPSSLKKLIHSINRI